VAPARLKVLTYNIQHGFDPESVPVVQRLARFIESRDADVVALQEVGRAALVHGGSDLVTYLRWRLPRYQVVYGPTRDLAGNVILSRYPVRNSGHVLLERQSDAAARGLTWATIATEAGEALLVSTHLDGFRSEDSSAETAELARFWAGRPRTLIGGDFNSVPGDRALEILTAASLVDLAAAAGAGGEGTFRRRGRSRRLDYVWGSPDVDALSAVVLPVPLSDHLPVEVTVRLRRE
jgi:endonuclease/exonuclease/phosphatase family metal-dependent hydrolase